FGVLPLYGQLCDYGSLQSHIHLAVTDALLGFSQEFLKLRPIHAPALPPPWRGCLRGDRHRIAARPWLRRPAALYIAAFQGTPLLMQLFLVFFGLPLLGFRIEAWSAAAVALTLCASAQVTAFGRTDSDLTSRKETCGLSVPTAPSGVMPPLLARR